jgi:hypothetical protein
LAFCSSKQLSKINKEKNKNESSFKLIKTEKKLEWGHFKFQPLKSKGVQETDTLKGCNEMRISKKIVFCSGSLLDLSKMRPSAYRFRP